MMFLAVKSTIWMLKTRSKLSSVINIGKFISKKIGQLRMELAENKIKSNLNMGKRLLHITGFAHS